MLTSSTKHRLPHLHGLVSPQKERQYGSITCVRIGTIGIPTHRCRAGFWPQLLSLQGKSRSSGKGAGSLSKLLVADGPGPLVRGARDAPPRAGHNKAAAAPPSFLRFSRRRNCALCRGSFKLPARARVRCQGHLLLSSAPLVFGARRSAASSQCHPTPQDTTGRRTALLLRSSRFALFLAPPPLPSSAAKQGRPTGA